MLSLRGYGNRVTGWRCACYINYYHFFIWECSLDSEKLEGLQNEGESGLIIPVLIWLWKTQPGYLDLLWLWVPLFLPNPFSQASRRSELKSFLLFIYLFILHLRSFPKTDSEVSIKRLFSTRKCNMCVQGCVWRCILGLPNLTVSF
jgi:hypothetical protein